MPFTLCSLHKRVSKKIWKQSCRFAQSSESRTKLNSLNATTQKPEICSANQLTNFYMMATLATLVPILYPNFSILYPNSWKHQKTFGFLLFSRGIRWINWLEMSKTDLCVIAVNTNWISRLQRHIRFDLVPITRITLALNFETVWNFILNLNN